MNESAQDLARLKRLVRILAAAIVLLAVATGTLVAREFARPAPRLDRDSLNALVSAIYQADHERPQGPADAPNVRSYDATYSEWRQKVVQTFDSLMNQ